MLTSRGGSPLTTLHEHTQQQQASEHPVSRKGSKVSGSVVSTFPEPGSELGVSKDLHDTEPGVGPSSINVVFRMLSSTSNTHAHIWGDVQFRVDLIPEFPSVTLAR